MQKIIKDNSVIEDHWVTIPRDHEGALPEGALLLPVNLWLAKKDSLDPAKQIGIWLNSDEDADTIGESVSSIPVIAVNFPAFADGRGFSLARLLRDRYNYTGEIRAIGGAIRDQLFYLKRCGFNAFDLALIGEDKEQALESALASLNDFTVTYQSSIEQPKPLFRRNM